MIRHLFLPLATLAAIGMPAYAAGTGTIEGTIVDQAHHVAAHASVNVACGSVHKSTTTDEAGHFALAGLPEGACTITVSGNDYPPATMAVTVTDGAIATVLVNVMTKAYAAQLAQLEEHEARYRGAGAPMPVMPTLMPAPAAPPRMAAKPSPSPATPAVASPPPPPPAKANVANAPAAVKPPPIANLAPVVPALRKAGAPKERALHAQQARNNRDDEMRRPQQVNGWAPVRVFPVPSYQQAYDGPRDDFRETVYWNGEVETDGHGDADVTFVASDAVTAFRATAEGFSATGVAGGGQATFQAKLPMTLDAHLPVEVTSGDTIRLPVTLANETDDAIDAQLATTFGPAFHLVGDPNKATIHLAAHAKQSLFFPLQVVASDGDGDVDLKLTGRGLSDEIHKTIRVVPKGFPIVASASGTVHAGAPGRHTVDLAGAMPGSIKATITLYPSPVAALTEGMAGMIREPGGCFEQTSSSNYPNIMILSYLGSTEAADPALIAKTQTVLDKGYKLLTGYETPEKGYEWFGRTPGHEALTAYGLMEFADMAKVYDIDPKMVERTADWLMSRRDHQGGFQRSSAALDSFGRASPATTDAYIMWALAEARRTAPLDKELAAQRTLGGTTTDPYLLALATNTNLVTKAPDAGAMAKRLANMQSKDGSFPGAKESITMSGGESLAIETTALATLALIKASPSNEYEPQIRLAVEWLNGKRGGYGSWGNTQATILGLKALTAYTEHARQMAAGGTATLVVNGKPAGTITFDKGRRDALVWNDVSKLLAAGKNTIEVQLDGTATLPYSIAIEYRSAEPASSPKTKVAVSTQLLATHASMGEGITLRAHVENTTTSGVPMTLARIGLPGGTVFQTWQLKELRDKGLIDFYETRPREVILYWRALAPSAKKDLDLDLLAAVPGTYEAPASSAYLYYTAEDKAWTKPVAITIASPSAR